MKVVALLAKQAGLTQQEFVEHYERVHAPLILRSFPQIVEYRRNFVDRSGVIGEPEPAFDVITEMWFEDRAAYHEMLRAHADPEIGGPVAQDADAFLDMSRTVQFVVDVRETDPGPEARV